MFPIFLKTLTIFLMILAGYLVRRMRIVDETFNRQLSLLLINLFYPALILSSMVRNFTLESLAANWTLPAGSAIIMATGWMLGRLAMPWLQRQPEALRRMFHFQCTMNNYSFLPILMGAALWGEKAVALVIFSGLGSELCVWTLGVKALTGQKLDRAFLKNLVSVPMVALMFSFAVLAVRSACERHGFAPVAASVPDEFLKTLLETCRMAGGATIPASALICGSRIAMLHPSKLWSPLMAGTCVLRLVVIPALCIAGLSLVPLPLDVRRVLVLISVMPAAMASVTLAEAYGGDADFSAAAILATHIVCLVTIPLWLSFAL